MPWGLAALMTAAWLTLPSPQRRFEPPTIFVAGDLCRQERSRGRATASRKQVFPNQPCQGRSERDEHGKE